MTTSSHPPSSLPQGVAAALNAVPVSTGEIENILSTGRGDPSQVRALFGDVSLDTLSWLAIHFGIDHERLLDAYAIASAEAAAANPELDALRR